MYRNYRYKLVPGYQNSSINNIDVIEHKRRNFGMYRIVVDLALYGWDPPHINVRLNLRGDG